MQKHYNYLTIDLDRKVYNKLKAMQYDTKSRYILVNLISNNIAYDLTDTTVKIYGIKNDKTIFFNNAVTKDTKNGKFEIELTNQALAVVGELKIQILVMGANGEKLTSSAFFIEVGRSIIDENAIESTNEFNVLTEGLKNLAEYDVYRQNVNNNKKNIEEHSKKLDEHSSQINTKANKDEVFTMSNMGQDVKEAMTGGSVAVVGKNTVLETNIVNKQVTEKKTNFFNVSKNLFNASDCIIGNIKDDGIFYPDVTTYVTTPYFNYENKLSFTGIANKGIGIRYISAFDKNHSFIKRYVYSTTEDTWTNADKSNIYFVRFGLETRYLNSQIMINEGETLLEYTPFYEPYINLSKIENKNKTFSNENFLLTYYKEAKPPLFKDGKIKFYQNTVFWFKNDRYELSEDTELTFSDFTTQSNHCVIYDFKNHTLRTALLSEYTTLNNYEVVIFLFNRQKGKSYITCNFQYVTEEDEGSEETGGTGDFDLNFKRSKEKCYFPQEVLSEYYRMYNNSMENFTYSTTTVTELYSKWNELISKSNGFLTKKVLGKDASGTYDIWQIKTNPKTYLKGQSSRYKKAKMLIVAGLHGFEVGGCFSLYYFMRELIENDGTNEVLTYLANNIEFVFIPIANPWGFDNKKYGNSNGVNINRNANANWSVNTTGDSAYNSGDSPSDQVETQYVQNMIDSNSDAFYYLDIHVKGQQPAKDFLVYHNLYSSSMYDLKVLHNLSCTNIERVTRDFKREFNCNLVESEFGGYIITNAQNGQTGSYALNKNIMGGVFENAYNLPQEYDYENDTAPAFSPLCQEVNTVSLVRWISQLVNYFNNKMTE